MDLDFIKWMVGYAEGFILGVDDSVIFCHQTWELPRSLKFVEDWELYPLLLQRAIEGINNSENYDIVQTRSNIVIYGYYKNPEPVYFELEPKLSDQAKEAALKYIYEQEI